MTVLGSSTTIKRSAIRSTCVPSDLPPGHKPIMQPCICSEILMPAMLYAKLMHDDSSRIAELVFFDVGSCMLIYKREHYLT